MGWTQLKVIKEDCDPNVDNNRDLPNNAFLVTYKIDGAEHFDLVAAAKQSEIFDNYYDKYKKDFVFMNNLKVELILNCGAIHHLKRGRKNHEWFQRVY